MKHTIFICLSVIALTFLLSGCSDDTSSSVPPDLSKCLNIGNALEAPKDQPWDVPMNISYFKVIKEAGFQTVRLPVRFSDYVDKSSTDYILDETFMTQIDAYIDEALAQNLTLILDLHHFTELMENPDSNRDCLIAIWEQLATRYKDYPATLVFELVNEPQGSLDSNQWNSMLADLVKAIRAVDKTHYLIVGGVNYNSIDSLSTLVLPADKRLIATVHYYEPNEVAFQGNEYHEGFQNLSGITWEGTAEEVSYLQNRLQTAKSWADQNNVPLFLGEFGISKTAPASTRVNWTAAVVREAEALDIDWGYWEFASGFGIYDLSASAWDEDMVNALLPQQ
ncbi:glycoside hydrolase family 5 protein [Konateibacter massiliensis]|uniref:glycoside hydrolase family 5 protein n=1 Tax=Konateibacter massiliensis TaxID=2002841 RepID=UPI000C15B4DF|nr:glycoside hydrolase family 5 protein [Konateibacter massiliensis]